MSKSGRWPQGISDIITASMDGVKVYFYDAAGHDEEITLEDIEVEKLKENQLLWVNILERDLELVEAVMSRLKMERMPLKKIVSDTSSPDIDRFDTFFRFCVNSVISKKKQPPERLMIDYVVGRNFVVTVHDGEVEYFTEFRQREKGETPIGEMDAEGFLATLLDLNIVSYFRALEQIERRVDFIDELVLKEDLDTDQFLTEMVKLRRDVSRLRRWLMPHRDVFYSLSRADFHQIAESDSLEQYKILNQHFESAVEAVEHSRETVLSVFELYATKSAQMTNIFVQRLTFLTLITGSIAVIAGVLGMNFKANIFEAENGFWVTVGGLVVVGVGLTVFARFRRWI